MAAETQHQQQQPQQTKIQPNLSAGSEPVVFRLQFLGSVEVDEENGGGRRRRKRLKKHMVEEAVTKIKVAILYEQNDKTISDVMLHLVS